MTFTRNNSGENYINPLLIFDDKMPCFINLISINVWTYPSEVA